MKLARLRTPNRHSALKRIGCKLLLGENIDRTDFFDLYSLITAHNEPHLKFGNPEQSREIERRLGFEARYVFNDLMLQLAYIIITRTLDSEIDNEESESTRTVSHLRAILDEFGLDTVLDQDEELEKVPREQLAQLSLADRARLVVAIRDARKKHGSKQYFTSTDGVWANLADIYTRLARTPDNTSALVLAIDRIFGLSHHNGALARQLDERDWIEQALNTRSVGGPGQLLHYCSSDVRNLLRSASHGTAPGEVSELQQVSVALNKELGKDGQCWMRGNQLELVVRAIAVMYQGNEKNPEYVTAVTGEQFKGLKTQQDAGMISKVEPMETQQITGVVQQGPGRQLTLKTEFGGSVAITTDQPQEDIAYSIVSKLLEAYQDHLATKYDRAQAE